LPQSGQGVSCFVKHDPTPFLRGGFCYRDTAFWLILHLKESQQAGLRRFYTELAIRQLPIYHRVTR